MALEGRDPVSGRFVKGYKGGPGKKRGKTRETIERELAEAAAVAAKLQARIDDADKELTPLDFMLRTLRSREFTYEQRFAASRAAAPYMHPQLQAIAHRHLDAAGNPLAPVISVTVRKAEPVPAALTHVPPKGETAQ